MLPRAALKVLDAAEEYRKGVEYFNRVVEVVEKMDNYEMMVSGAVFRWQILMKKNTWLKIQLNDSNGTGFFLRILVMH